MKKLLFHCSIINNNIFSNAGNKISILNHNCCTLKTVQYFHSATHHSKQQQDIQDFKSIATNKYFPTLSQYLKEKNHLPLLQALQQIDFTNSEINNKFPTFHEYNNNGQLLKVIRNPPQQLTQQQSSTQQQLKKEEELTIIKQSAVFSLFFIFKNQLSFILLQKTITRKNTNYQHGGQLAFPGGTFDKNLDKSLLETAFRETIEEIGNFLEIELINDTLPITTTGTRTFIVKPFIGKVNNLLNDNNNDYNEINKLFKLQESEIEHLFIVPLEKCVTVFEAKGKTKINENFNHFGPIYNLNNLYSVTKGKIIDDSYAHLWGYTSTVITKIIDHLNSYLENNNKI
ncbi:hypothetical protein ABK040_011080 [Willaertia magna]